MFTITRVEAIRLTRTVDRAWVERVLRFAHPGRADESAKLSDSEIAAEQASVGQRAEISAVFEALLAGGAAFSRAVGYAAGVCIQGDTGSVEECPVHDQMVSGLAASDAAVQ